MKIRDCVMTFHFKDSDTVQMACEHLRSVVGVERIFIVGNENPRIEGSRFIHEESFVCLRKGGIVGHALRGREGWIFQQLIKLAAPQIIIGIEDTFLVCDADAIFLTNPYRQTPNGVFPYCRAYTGEYHQPYRDHFLKVMNRPAPAGISFINHHMIFDRLCLDAMKREIETVSGVAWDTSIIEALDPTEQSSFSEYDLYGNLMFTMFPSKAFFQKFTIKDVAHVPTEADCDQALREGYDILSAQRWARQ